MMMTTGALVGYANDGIGFLTGLVTAAILSMNRLGLRAWWVAVWEGIRSVPKEWKEQNTTRPVLPVSQPSEDESHHEYHDEQTSIDPDDKPKLKSPLETQASSTSSK
jgi:hypothetical protein